jgi:hypothetical protein
MVTRLPDSGRFRGGNRGRGPQTTPGSNAGLPRRPVSALPLDELASEPIDDVPLHGIEHAGGVAGSKVGAPATHDRFDRRDCLADVSVAAVPAAPVSDLLAQPLLGLAGWASAGGNSGGCRAPGADPTYGRPRPRTFTGCSTATRGSADSSTFTPSAGRSFILGATTPRRRPTRAGRQPELRQLGGEGRGRHEHVVELRRVWRAAARARLDVTRQPLSGGHHLLIVAATVAGHPISSSVERLSRTQQSRCRGPRGSRRIRASRLDWVLPRRRSPFALQSSRLTTS